MVCDVGSGGGAGADGCAGDAVLRRLLPRCRFPSPGVAVACAVSGGADSLALLVLACAWGLEVTAIHVDHGLRPGSSLEAAPVEAAAKRFGALFSARRVDVAAGPNLEARARRARYQALPEGVMTGHTADDQAETVLLNLLRGAGADGLAGMRQHGRVSRPLLGLRRHETRELCEALSLPVFEDPDNADLAFTRNRIRHTLLPVMAELSRRDPVPVLARQAELLADDVALLDELAAAIDPSDASALAATRPALARRAIRRWLRSAEGPERHPPSAAEIERVLAVARGAVVACQLSGGREVRRSRGRLRLSGGPAPDAPDTGVADSGVAALGRADLPVPDERPPASE
jgi:tRNA(Ile)-lysidine synthase